MATENQADDVLELSDEEFMAKGGAAAAVAAVAAGSDDDSAEKEAERKAQEEADTAAKAAEQAEADRMAAEAAANKDGEGQDDEADAAAGKQQGEAEGDEDPATKKVEQDPSKEGKDSKAVEKDPAKKEPGTEEDPAKKATDAAIDYKVQYEELLKPFKANGRDIQVNDVAEARRLMQMGANYNKKMAGLKPHLTMLKMLENNGLNTVDKISFLIDLDKKNPEAISKLVKESGIDPLDLSPEKAGAYKAGNHSVSDAEVELDTVLDDLKGTNHYHQLLNVVGTEWDANSKQAIAANPNVLRVIDGHMQSGIYDLVATEMARQRALGTLSGLSDLDAYRQVGDAMNSAGKFAHLFAQPGQADNKGTQAPAAKVIVNPNPKKADDDKREQQRRAAAPSRGAAPANKGADPNFNPLNMSDDEFANFKPNFKGK